jgi:ComF family protein
MGWVGSIWNATLALALPPRCAGCGAVVGRPHAFCAGCWSALRFLGPPCCAGCGVPFAFDRGEGARCAACIAAPPRHAGVHAAVVYGDAARALALRLKHGRRIGLAETMARLMARRMPAGADLLVPVPLHRWRLWSRGFNQSLLIAQALSRRGGVPVERAALLRVKPTPMLRGLGRKERAKAVAGVFAIALERKAALKGRHIVLVDDVHTSGATSDVCVKALLRAGAARVSILVWARVLDDADD